MDFFLQMKEYNYDDFYTVVPEQGYQKADVQVLLINANFLWNSTIDGSSTKNTFSSSLRQSSSEESPSLSSDIMYAELYGAAESNTPRLTLQDIDLELHKVRLQIS